VRRFVAVAGLSASLGLAVPCAAERFEFEEPHMGTLVRLVLYAPDRAAAAGAARAAFDRIADLDAALSDYRDSSEVSQLAVAAGGPAVSIGRDLFAVLSRAEDLWRRSGGAFDVTVGPVVRLWRRTLRTGDWPDPVRREEALALVGSEKMHLDAAARSVRLERPGMRIDLGGIAKGYAGDEALGVLRRRGVPSALVAVGGDVVAGEAPPGDAGWVVAVARDAALDEPSIGIDAKKAGDERLILRNAAVSTSGDSEQWIERESLRYSHILDPRTGIGLTGRRRATVVAPEGITADSLATAACVLGPAEGVALVESIPGALAIVHQQEAGTRASRGWLELRRAN
jgi:thiamine biosynthesis lipoprotein